MITHMLYHFMGEVRNLLFYFKDAIFKRPPRVSEENLSFRLVNSIEGGRVWGLLELD